MKSRYKQRKINGRHVNEHVAIAEQILGRRLKGEEQVHHFDENTFNNAHPNLVICPNRAYHMLLHVRKEALIATGDPDQRKCPFCKGYSPKAVMKHKEGEKYFHHVCKMQWQRESRAVSG